MKTALMSGVTGQDGAYAGENDKTRFDGIDNRDIIINDAK
jgi:GDP-D-mannose dehydratase